MQQVHLVFLYAIVNCFPNTMGICVDRLQKTNSIFHHIFKRNIFHPLFSLPPLQPLRHEREQVSLTHQPMSPCVHWHRWAVLITQERTDTFSIPPLPTQGIFSTWPLHGPSPRGWQDAGAWQDLAWEPECKCISAGEERGRASADFIK